MMGACIHCGTAHDTRPYGTGGTPVCFDCIKSDPAREEEAKRQFMAQLAACGPGPVMIDDGTGVGPYPLARKPS